MCEFFEAKNIPVVILSAKGEEFDVILGLELGADDYVAKPFSPKILFSRVKAVLRRGKEPEKTAKLVKFGEFALEIDRYLLRKAERSIPLTLSEFGILRRLVTNQGKVLTRNQLLDDINNDDSFIVDRNIDVHIASLRKKLGPTFDWIETVRGVGYRFRDDFIFLSASEKELISLIPPIRSFLQEKLHLELHPNKIILRKPHQGIDFLGTLLFEHHKLLRTKTKHRMHRKLVAGLREYQQGKKSFVSMSLSAKYSLDIRDLSSPSSLKNRWFFRVWAFDLANLFKFASLSTLRWDSKSSRISKPLLCG